MTQYALGSADPEIQRLDLQADWLRAPTRLLLEQAGIGPGRRVLDLGTGLGHVATEVADLIGPTGEVVGLDNDPVMVEAAQVRASGRANVRFVEGDVATWRDAEPFDAVVGRLILFHLPDPVAVLRHHLSGLRPGGRAVMLDYDLGTLRAEPADPLTTWLSQLVRSAFRAVGADPTIGARLHRILGEAGAVDVGGLAVAQYVPGDGPLGPALFAGILRTLAPAITGHGLATAEALDVDTLEPRLADSLRTSDSVVVPPLLAAAWGIRP